METKAPWQSKTVLVSALVGLLGAVALFWPQAGAWTQWINSHGAEIGIGWGVLGTLLRFLTKDKISLGE